MASKVRWGVHSDEGIREMKYPDMIVELNRLRSLGMEAECLRSDEGGWKDILGNYIEKIEIDDLLIGGSFVYENPAFDWNRFVVKKYADAWRTSWWIEEKHLVESGDLQSCAMLTYAEARARFVKFDGWIGA
jgi:hypothetical protein